MCHGLCHGLDEGWAMARGDGYSLIKRKRNGRELPNFHVRIYVPVNLQGKIGKKDVLLSLGTGDKRLANSRALKLVEETYAKWNQQINGPPNAIASMDLPSIAVDFAYDGMLSGLSENRKTWPTDQEGFSNKLKQRDFDLARLTRKFHDGDFTYWEGAADNAIEERDLPIRKGSAEYDAFVQALAETSIDALSVFNRQTKGELNAAARSPLVREVKAKKASLDKNGETMIELFDRWTSEMVSKDEMRSDTVDENRVIIKRFSDFIGTNRDMSSITPAEVADYRDTMRDLPPKWMSKREFQNIDMREAAKKARELNMPRIAYTTINKHLSTISPLFKWLARQPRWAGLKNPCEGLFYDKVKGKNPRPPFKTSHLNQIFSSPLFTGFQSNGHEHVTGRLRADDWRYWIPLIALFSGARIGEIAQLRVRDIRKDRDEWFIHICHSPQEGLVTKSGKSRPAAVHPMLEDVGFIDFHSRQLPRAEIDENAPLFPELSSNARGQIGVDPSRWWRNYLKKIGIKDSTVNGGDGFGAHSFRHTLADLLRREAELLDEQIAVCLGHSNTSTTSGYGELSQGTVTKMKEWINGVRFDGVDFTHLIEAKPA